MIKLSKLFRDIESFYIKAIQDYSIVKYSQMQSYVSPDTDEDDGSPDLPNSPDGSGNDIYGDLTKAAHEVSDSSLGSELLLIAEMYKKVVQLGRGYYSINRAISNIMNNYLEDEDSPEQSSVEDLLNEVVRDLRIRAGGQANLNKPDAPEVVAQLKKFKDDFNDRAVQDEIEDLSQFDDKATPTFDFTGGVNPENAQKGSGRGYSRTNVRSLNNWVEHYRNEKQRYLNDFSQYNNESVKSKRAAIIKILDQLIEKITYANRLQQELIGVPDPDRQSQLDDLKQEISKLRTEQSKIKSSLRRYLLDEHKNKLQTELKDTKDNRERFLLQQKIELNKVLLSQDRKKGEEVRLRKILISSMGGGNSLGQETLQKLMDKIQEAAAQKTPIEEVRKDQAQQVKKIKDTGDLKGLTLFFQQQIANFKGDISKTIKRRLKKDPMMVPYIKAIDDAEATGDKIALESAKKAEAAFVSQKIANDQFIQSIVKTLPEFYNFRDMCNNLDTSNPEAINNTILTGQHLISTYGDAYRVPAAATAKIIDYIKRNT
jgi:hypothetical protein